MKEMLVNIKIKIYHKLVVYLVNKLNKIDEDYNYRFYTESMKISSKATKDTFKAFREYLNY